MACCPNTANDPQYHPAPDRDATGALLRDAAAQTMEPAAAETPEQPTDASTAGGGAPAPAEPEPPAEASAAGGEAAPSAEPASAEEPDAAASDKASETDGATPLPPGPPPLPPGWVEAKDPRYNNATYWFHEVTKETSWVRPLALRLPSPP